MRSRVARRRRLRASRRSDGGSEKSGETDEVPSRGDQLRQPFSGRGPEVEESIRQPPKRGLFGWKTAASQPASALGRGAVDGQVERDEARRRERALDPCLI